MKLKQANFADNEEPTDFTVEVTVDELALIYRICGWISPAELDEAFPKTNRWTPVLESVCEAATILNQFYEEGIDHFFGKAAYPIIIDR